MSLHPSVKRSGAEILEATAAWIEKGPGDSSTISGVRDDAGEPASRAGLQGSRGAPGDALAFRGDGF